MDYLARESADLSDGLWNRIDETVIGTARNQLTCRRFLKVFGPLGAGVTTVAVDGVNKEEVLEDGIGRIVGRTQLELPLFYEDFTLLSRDMEYAAQTGYPLDLSVAIAAAMLPVVALTAVFNAVLVGALYLPIKKALKLND